ncbi:hypothetical protein SAMN04488570_1377 [Nocardioides scoriae]|uniref:Uncharacterized protein n=1 Tax=Nocardioides scoriae TaxID=642780 RepID=A0A1H1QCD7_9ACTN|nr:hypothetical protein [Nocardioides scoriae]SDS21090.1 hypothetical protein SAMN04488570_1377 [Nocardioides scoriae]
MAEVASAFVSILPSTRGFGTALEGDIGADVDRVGKSAGGRFGSVFGTALKLGGITAGVSSAPLFRAGPEVVA